MRKDLIENKLRPMAVEILNNVARHVEDNRNYWESKDWSKVNMKWEYFNEGNDVRFYENDAEKPWNYITFYNVRPDKIDDVEVHNPVLENNEIVDADIDSIVNDNETILDWGFTYTKVSEDTITDNVGGSISALLEQEIFYGSGGKGSTAKGIGGNTKIALEIEAHFEKTWNRKTAISKTHTLNLKIPANSKMEIVQNKGRAKYRQKTKTTATLDFGVEIQTRGFWYVKLPSLDDFVQAVGGYFPTKNEYGVETNNMIRYWKKNPINIDYLKDKLDSLGKAVVEKEITFDRASTGDVKVKSKKIEK
ncbi:MAG: hypothetical protein MPJ25_10395 [Pirellulales bacterium]|nr:hypothetical protein [Pirellulales bacterium]